MGQVIAFGSKEALEAAKNMNVKEFREKLEKHIKDLNNLITDLADNSGSAQAIITGLQDESTTATTWFSDNVFRPGNKQRKQDAINAMQSLKTLMENSKTIALNLTKKNMDLRSIGDDMEAWRKTIIDIFPVIEASICVPQAHLPSTLGWDIAIGVLGGATIISVFVCAPAIPLLVAATAIVAFIGGIVTGEKRMKAFNNLEDNANTAYNQVKADIYDKLEESHGKMVVFFDEATQAFKTAGWYEGDASNTAALSSAIREKVEEMQKIASAYKAMLSDIKWDIPEESAAQKEAETFWDKTKPEEINAARQLLLTARYLETGMTPTEIANRLHLDEPTTKRLEARAMLAQGKTPEEISTQLDIPVDEVRKIQTVLQSKQAA